MSLWMLVRNGLIAWAMILVGLAVGAEAPSETPATQADELESAVEQLGIDEPTDRTALRVVLDSRREDPTPPKKRTEVRLEVVEESAATVERLGDNSLPADDQNAADEELATDEAAPTDGEPSDEATEEESVVAEDEPAAAESSTDEASDSPQPLNEPAPPQDLATPELSVKLQELRAKVRRVLGWYYHRNLNTRDHNPWEMMHGVIAYGCDTKIRRGEPDGQPLNGISWLCVNGECHGVRMLTINRRGELDAQVGQFVQGHPGQLMAILAQCHVPVNYQIQANGREFTMRNLIETEMKSCEAGTELTFKLMGLSHYLDTETTWKDHRGGTWSIARLIQEEIKQPILYTAACGGTHRLMGLSYCNFKRVKEGRPIEGQFARAKKYVQDYHRYAFALQNPDGSFSTDWFKGRQNKPDTDRKLKTTGHITEWLAFSLPEDQLTDPRMVRAIDFIASILDQGHGHKWEIGPIGHGLHALRIYDRRLFKPLDVPASSEPPQPLVEQTAEQPAAEIAATDRTKDQRSTDKPPARSTTEPASVQDNAATDDEASCSGEEQEAAQLSEETPAADSDEPVDAPIGHAAVAAPRPAAPKSNTASVPSDHEAVSAPGEPKETAAAKPGAAKPVEKSSQSLQFRRRSTQQSNPFRDGEIRTGSRTRTLR